jgi:hypothetical protein
MRRMIFLLGICAAAYGQADNPLTDAVTARFQSMRHNLIGTAAAMPEESYSFRLTAAQRPFGEWIGHVTMANLHFCKMIMGPAEGHPAEPPHTGSTKAELAKALQDSFEFCDAALKGMNDRKALTAVMLDGKKVYPVDGMIGLIVSGNEHYGTLVGYLRSKGITPPSSAKQ